MRSKSIDDIVDRFPGLTGPDLSMVPAKEPVPEDIEIPLTDEEKLSRLKEGLREELRQEFRAEYGGAVVRDFGMDSKSVQDAVQILRESRPEIAVYLDRFGSRRPIDCDDLSERARGLLMRRWKDLAWGNPIANRGLRIRTDLIVSRGFSPRALGKGKRKAWVQKHLDSYWEMNDWDAKLPDRVLNLQIYGEWLRMKNGGQDLITPDGKISPGVFQATHLSPNQIQQVYVNPWDLESRLMMELRIPVKGGSESKEFAIARKIKHGKDADKFVGDVFYLPINSPLGSTRGISDLLPAMEWLDIHGQLMINEAERTNLALKFAWALKITGASNPELEARAAKMGRNPIGNGTMLYFNEREELKPLVPSITALDTVPLIKELFKLGWGALGLPEPFYTETTNMSKALAGEMREPIWAWARTRKHEIMEAILLEIDYALQEQMISEGEWFPLDERRVSLESRDPDKTAFDALGVSLKSTAEACGVAIQWGLMDQGTASQVFMYTAEGMGVRIDGPLEGKGPVPVGAMDADSYKLPNLPPILGASGQGSGGNGAGGKPPSLKSNGRPIRNGDGIRKSTKVVRESEAKLRESMAVIQELKQGYLTEAEEKEWISYECARMHWAATQTVENMLWRAMDQLELREGALKKIYMNRDGE